MQLTVFENKQALFPQFWDAPKKGTSSRSGQLHCSEKLGT